MGFLSWLFGAGSQTPVKDLIWLTGRYKLAGILAELSSAEKEQQCVLLVAHFPETLHWLKESAAAGGLNVTALEYAVAPAHEAIPTGLFAALGSQLTERLAAPLDDERAKLKIVVAERHFLHHRDDAIVAFADSLSCKCEVRFHLAIDEPLMKRFGGEVIANTLRRLGMREDEPIDSPLIQRRIRQAQKHIASMVPEPREAASAQKWLEANGLK